MDDSGSVENPAEYSVDVVLRDGGSIHVRAIRPDDRERLLAHFRGLSEDAKYHRFFGLKRTLSEQELVRLTDLDFVNHVGLVTTITRDGVEEFIGVARYVRGADPSRAEVAFAVLDEHQGRGIATVLLEHLGRIARAGGITEFEADVLGDNNRMLEVFGKSGFRVRRAASAGVIHLAFPTAETPASVAASIARERTAAAQSVARILRPRSVAVIGASRDVSKIGGATFANLLASRFNGPVYAVNHDAPEVQGRHAYPNVAAIKASVDLAIIAVPAALVEQQVGECARAGVHCLVVITAGFAETGAAGLEMERRIVNVVRRSGMRMIGPNCLGILNTDPEVRLNATFAQGDPPAGNIAMFTQSGALGVVILNELRSRGLGVSSFVSAGNRADVSNNDLIAYWADDPATAVIVLYLESVGNPRKFAQFAREVARVKPIIAVKSGRSTAGTRAASSHSASLANLDVGVDALFEQAGVIRTETLEQLFNVSAILSTQPLPPGPRVGVVSNAGGPAILFADACEARGLSLPELSDSTLKRLREFLSPMASLGNPVDVTAHSRANDFARAISLVGADPNVDSIVAIYVPPMVLEAADAARGIAEAADSIPLEKPVMSVFFPADEAQKGLDSGKRGKIPVYRFPEDAALALAAAYRYARWRARAPGETSTLSQFARETIRAVVNHAIAARGGESWVSVSELATILRAAGIEVAQSEQTSAADAAEIAERIGYPLVAKAIVPGLVHKSDIGGVILGLKSKADVAKASADIRERILKAGLPFEGILLQRQIQEGLEMMAGVILDPTFGPLLVCGYGGANVELFNDVAFRLSPVSNVDAHEMITGLRCSRLFDGYRAAPPRDRDAFAKLLMSISALVEIIPEMTELDLNPVKVLEPQRGAIVVDGRMRLKAMPSRISVRDTGLTPN